MKRITMENTRFTYGRKQGDGLPTITVGVNWQEDPQRTVPRLMCEVTMNQQAVDDGILYKTGSNHQLSDQMLAILHERIQVDFDEINKEGAFRNTEDAEGIEEIRDALYYDQKAHGN